MLSDYSAPRLIFCQGGNLPKKIIIKKRRFILAHSFRGLGLVSWPHHCASWQKWFVEQSCLLHSAHSGQYAKRKRDSSARD